MASALGKFFDVDGSFGRKVMPLPHNTFKTQEARDMDKMSALSRINQISESLSRKERDALESFILLCSRRHVGDDELPRDDALVGNVWLHLSRLS